MNMNFNSEEYKLDPNKFRGNYIDTEEYRLDPNRWSIPQKNINNSVKKYMLTTIFFVMGIILVSIIKNETRMIQRDINSLHVSINEIKSNLYEANLDHQVITSPENVDQLAKLYLDSDFTFYKKSQIKKLSEGKIKKIESKKEKIVKKLDQIKINDKHLKTSKIFKNEKLAVLTETEGTGRYKKWFLSQIFKLFLGIPPVPGK